MQVVLFLIVLMTSLISVLFVVWRIAEHFAEKKKQKRVKKGYYYNKRKK